jgi:molybdenum cofactor biosynthesis protein B
MSSSHEEQASRSLGKRPIACAVLTISDTRTLETDISGSLIVDLLVGAGHRVVERSIVRDESPEIDRILRAWLARPDIAAILATGGTGIARRDTTIEVVRRLLTIELEGFGELFRMLSYEQVQGAAMLSRAVAGLVISPAPATAPATSHGPGSGAAASDSGPSRQAHETYIFAMPGSRNAVETAMMRLIVPQLAHLVWERQK